MRMLTWQALLCAVVMVITGGAAAHAQSQVEQESIELFAAMEAGQISVEVIPRDAKQLVMIVTNETDQPLTIQLPGAALAQFFPQPGGQQNNFGPNQQTSSSPQGLGFGFPAGQNGGRQGFGNQLGQQPLFPGGQFNVLAGRTIRARVPCVCLEYGKPEPTPHHPYEIRPLTNFSDDTRLATLLESMSYGNYTQREAQLAVWHVTDDVSWEDFEAARIEHLNGPSERAYTEGEIAHAKKLLEQVDEQLQSQDSAEPSAPSPGEVAQGATAAAVE